jgi:hypothetical protein
VQAAVKKMPPLLRNDSSSETCVATSSTYILQGQPAYLYVILSGSRSGDSSDSTSPQLKLGIFLCLLDLHVNAVRRVSASFQMMKAPGSTAGDPFGRVKDGYSASLRSRFMIKNVGKGFPGLVKLGAVGSWQAAEAALRSDRLVHAGGQGDEAAGPHLLVKVQLQELL